MNTLSAEKKEQMDGVTVALLGNIAFNEVGDIFDFLSVAERLFVAKYAMKSEAPRRTRQREVVGNGDDSEDEEERINRKKAKEAARSLMNIESGLAGDHHNILPCHPSNWSKESLTKLVDDLVAKEPKGYITSELEFLRILLKENLVAWKAPHNASALVMAKRLLKLKAQMIYPAGGNSFDKGFEVEVARTKDSLEDVAVFFKVAVAVFKFVEEADKKGVATRGQGTPRPPLRKGFVPGYRRF